MRVPIQFREPLLGSLPSGLILSAAREIKAGKESIRYDIHDIVTEKNVAYATVKRSKLSLFLDGLYVLPEYRSKGIATYLVRLVELNHSDEDLYIKPDPFKDKAVSRESLIEFYGRLGFEQIPESKLMVFRRILPV